MKKNKDVYGITDICSYYGLSESTIRKKVRESRNGESDFPLPLFKRGCKALWRKSDIEAWSGEEVEPPKASSPTVAILDLFDPGSIHEQVDLLSVSHNDAIKDESVKFLIGAQGEYVGIFVIL